MKHHPQNLEVFKEMVLTHQYIFEKYFQTHQYIT